MQIILLPGESIYAVVNGQVACISASPCLVEDTDCDLCSPDDSEEETCECGSPYTDCDGSDCPADEEDGLSAQDAWCEGYKVGLADGCEDSDDDDDEDISREDILADDLFNSDFSDESEEECSDECCSTDTPSETDCPCCEFFEATDYDEYGTGHHSHSPDCSASHEVN